jgi:hypothetical protein
LLGSADTCSGHCILRVPEVGIHVGLPLRCRAAQRLPLPLRKVPQSLPAAHLPIPCASVPGTCAIGVLETHRLARVMKGGVLESLPFFSLLMHPCRSLHVTSLLQGPRKLQTICVRQFDSRSWMEEVVHQLRPGCSLLGQRPHHATLTAPCHAFLVRGHPLELHSPFLPSQKVLLCPLLQLLHMCYRFPLEQCLRNLGFVHDQCQQTNNSQRRRQYAYCGTNVWLSSDSMLATTTRMWVAGNLVPDLSPRVGASVTWKSSTPATESGL